MGNVALVGETGSWLTDVHHHLGGGGRGDTVAINRRGGQSWSVSSDGPSPPAPAVAIVGRGGGTVTIIGLGGLLVTLTSYNLCFSLSLSVRFPPAVSCSSSRGQHRSQSLVL